ncbi:DNA-processing protein DprA [Polaribacter litorisediminis]|uniref:DNA-processing protein DprA n=1 Tax=Polaribacter litorisediminis TaxID=1908341 RepID=UPI001CC06E96|nr:DNA-processing protein DprA [Polaribacter litorisediminis]UAM98241.1 DNA-processing protein DprA [Polaribacter litorisediminis]
MKEEKLLAILRLQKSKAIGDVLAKKLIVHIGDVEQIFKEKTATLQKINGIGNHVLKHLFDENNAKLAEQELRYIQKNKIEFSYFLDDDYPVNLQNCIDSPILFFKDGTINLDNPKIISVVGTRNMSSYGRDFCSKIIADLALYNPIIVSGFAYGVDICAHKAAIKNKLQTIAVLAHGFEQIYPKVHKKYINQVNENGGFITEFWSEDQPLRENFLKRNRIVAGISKATIIIESAEKGGSLVTADIANSYNRDVFALPGRTTDIYSKGCNNLIKNNRATLLTSANDVIKMLNWDITEKPKQIIQKQLFIELNDTEQKIYDLLSEKGAQLLDIISLECNIPIYQLSSILLQMELKGVTKPLPGKMFELA